jgi:hypothetical protein
VRRAGGVPPLGGTQRFARGPRLMDDADDGSRAPPHIRKPVRWFSVAGQLHAAGVARGESGLDRAARGRAEHHDGPRPSGQRQELANASPLHRPPAAWVEDEAHEVCVRTRRRSRASLVANSAHLHDGPHRVRRCAEPRGALRRRRDQRAQARGRIHVGEQGRADQHGVRAGLGGTPQVRGRCEAALRDECCPGVARGFDEPERAVHVHLQRREVARVDPDERGVRGQRLIQLERVMNLDERVQPCLGYLVDQRPQPVAREQPRDEEHRAGAQNPCLPDLVALDDEVLAQHRQADARGGFQVGVRAVEAGGLGEHRERGRAGVVIGRCQRSDGMRPFRQRGEPPR